MAVSSRVVAALGLLALGPVIVFALGRSEALTGAITAINVLLIAASLWIALRPAEAAGHGH